MAADPVAGSEGGAEMAGPERISRIELARALLRSMGIGGVLRRTRHEVRSRRNAFRLAPKHPDGLWRREKGAPPPGFRVDPESWREDPLRAMAIREGERVLARGYPAFGAGSRPFPALSGWHRNPVTGIRAPSDLPWWRIPLLGKDGDVKDLWEPARFGWVYPLLRAHLATGDLRYSDFFHAVAADFHRANPPYRGVQWACGQETALRAIALLHAEAIFPAGEEEAVRIRELLAWSGERIADAIGYAISQRNNHGISEANGLVQLGIRFRGLHPEAKGWLRLGTRILHALVPDQFAEDGWYIQHSFNYQRLALQQLLLARRTLRGRGGRWEPALDGRIDRAVDLLEAMIDPFTGEPPNHGANDGADSLPLGFGGHRDFRGLLTFAAKELDRVLPARITPDPAFAAWTGMPSLGEREDDVPRLSRGRSGWAVLEKEGIRLFLRAGRYRSRPSHLDPLHLDLRVKGREILVDPGTFAYNRPEPWRNGLVSGRVHNGPLVDDMEPAERGPRFLWHTWPDAELVEARLTPDGAHLEGVRPSMAGRSVHLDGTRLTIEDRLLGESERTLVVRWTLAPEVDPARIELSVPVRVLTGEEGDVRGWFSPTYGVRVPTRVVEGRIRGGPGTTIVTRIDLLPFLREGREGAGTVVGSTGVRAGDGGMAEGERVDGERAG